MGRVTVHGSWFRDHRFLIRVAIFLLFITSYQLPVTNYQCLAQDKIVAVVNQEVITQRDLEDFINFMRIQLSQEFSRKDQLEKKINSIKADLLERLIEDRLILQEARRENVVIDDARVEAKINGIKRQYPSEMQFQEALFKQGLAQADIELKIREQMLMYSIIEDKVRKKIMVLPAEVTFFYEDNPGLFKTPQVRLAQAFSVKDEGLSKKIFDELKKDAQPQDLEQKYPLSLNMLTVTQNDDSLAKDIKEIVFKLDVGEISRPVKIKNTYYIFKLNEIVPQKLATLSQAQDQIYAFLLDKKMQESLAAWMEELKKNAYIKIF